MRRARARIVCEGDAPTWSTERPEAAASARIAAMTLVASESTGASTTSESPVATASTASCWAGVRSPIPRSFHGSRSRGLGGGRETAREPTASSSPARARTRGESARRSRSSRSRSSGVAGCSKMPRTSSSRTSTPSRTPTRSRSSESATDAENPCEERAPSRMASASQCSPCSRSAASRSGSIRAPGSRVIMTSPPTSSRRTGLSRAAERTVWPSRCHCTCPMDRWTRPTPWRVESWSERAIIARARSIARARLAFSRMSEDRRVGASV